MLRTPVGEKASTHTVRFCLILSVVLVGGVHVALSTSVTLGGASGILNCNTGILVTIIVNNWKQT
jgi:hypothetical protein